MLSPTRMYKGLPAKTIGVHQTVRVNIHGQSTVKIAEVSKPPACKAHQFTGGRVWAYEADPNYSCCKTNNCLSHFDTPDPRIIEARAPLFEIGLTAQQRREKLLRNWQDLQIVGKNGKAVQVCVQAPASCLACQRAISTQAKRVPDFRDHRQICCDPRRRVLSCRGWRTQKY